MSAPWVAIQRNPTSGAGLQRAELLHLVTHLRRLGIRPRLYSQRERLRQRLEIANERQSLVCLVAAGGDGTVGDLVNRFPDLPVAVLPLGTENLLAGYLKIPGNGRFVAEMIAAGCCRTIDVGVVNGRRFLLMVTAGIDADIVHKMQARRRGHIRKWNYLQPILDTLRSYRYPKLRISAEGGDLSVDQPLSGRLVVVANLPAYAMGLPLAASAEGSDGLFDLRVFRRRSAFQMFRYLYKVLLRQHETLADVVSGRARQVRITCDTPVPIQCDGDPAGFTPAEISILPGALKLIVPNGPAR
ncbi:MAG TPA: diacylglycerol kinase family protein [Planctomycetaceae bacterium]|nr:diacylglycerol kinase family protein [Planctomycetaceae bacterium]